MCENNTIRFIMKIGIDEYSGFEAYIKAIKTLNLPIIPQLKTNVLNIDALIKSFHIMKVDFDASSKKTYEVYDSRSVERYGLSGAIERMSWVDKKIELYKEHGWSIVKLGRYNKGLKQVESQIAWNNKNKAE